MLKPRLDHQSLDRAWARGSTLSLAEALDAAMAALETLADKE